MNSLKFNLVNSFLSHFQILHEKLFHHLFHIFFLRDLINPQEDKIFPRYVCIQVIKLFLQRLLSLYIYLLQMWHFPFQFFNFCLLKL